MAKEKRIPNYRKMYPEASEEVIALLRQGERKLLYHEYDLKVEKFVVDEEKQKVADEGTKLSFELAKLLFPHIAKKYSWRY